jgi:hypothetical protein
LPASWIEAGDGGDPKVTAAVRDHLVQLSAPFEGRGDVLLESPLVDTYVKPAEPVSRE